MDDISTFYSPTIGSPIASIKPSGYKGTCNTPGRTYVYKEAGAGAGESLGVGRRTASPNICLDLSSGPVLVFNYSETLNRYRDIIPPPDEDGRFGCPVREDYTTSYSVQVEVTLR